MPAEDLYYSALDHLAAGRNQQAIADFRAALGLNPSFADAAHGLVRALQNESLYQEAVSVAHQLIAQNADDVLAHTSLSILYQHMGLVSEAEAESARAKILRWKLQLHRQE